MEPSTTWARAAARSVDATTANRGGVALAGDRDRRSGAGALRICSRARTTSRFGLASPATTSIRSPVAPSVEEPQDGRQHREADAGDHEQHRREPECPRPDPREELPARDGDDVRDGPRAVARLRRAGWAVMRRLRAGECRRSLPWPVPLPPAARPPGVARIREVLLLGGAAARRAR